MGDRAGSGVHRFVGYAEPVGILLGAIGIVAGGDLLVCLIPSGALIATVGVLIARNHDGLRDRLRERHPGVWNFGFAKPAANVTFGAALLTFIGLCWLALGVASQRDQL
jgi:hypothetical protein